MNKKLGVSILSIAFLLAIAGGMLYIFRYPLHFPVWEPAVEAEPIPGVVSKEFVSIEDYDEDCVAVNFILTCDKEVGHKDKRGVVSWWVDYNRDGDWYTVYRAPMQRADAIFPAFNSLTPPGQYEREIYIPRKIVEWKGRYRQYSIDTGYLEFTVD